MIKLLPIPALKDNYIWMIIHTASSQCMIVDPGEAAPIIAALKKYALKLTAILVTHHHGDHTHGIPGILSQHAVPVFGYYQEPIAHLSQPLQEGEYISIPGIPISLQTIAIPGHTLGHCAYYTDGMLFSGDTLFTGGCGRLFEGTAKQMYDSLMKLAMLPNDTLVYCGHEYTLANLQFAKEVEPDNEQLKRRIAEVQILREQGQPTVPVTLAEEISTNPFLRCHLTTVKQAAEYYCQHTLASPLEVFTVIREWKNQYR